MQTAAINAVIIALGLIGSVLLSRWLGPTGRGEVAAAMLWPMLLVYLGSVGLIPASLFYSAQSDTDVELLFANAVVLAVGLSLLVMSLGYGILPWLLSSQTDAVVAASRWYLLMIPVSLVTQCGAGILQGQLRITVVNGLRVIVPMGYLLGVLVLMYVGELTLSAIISLHLVLNAIALAGVVLMLRRIGVRFTFHFDPLLARRMMRYGAQVQAGDITQGANLRLDQSLMAAWLPPVQLGIYVAAVSVSNLVQVVSTAMRMVIVPRIAREPLQSNQLDLLVMMFRRYLVVGIVLSVTLAIATPVVIPIVFGAQFRDSILPAEILIIGALALGAKDVLAGSAQALGRPWLASKAELSTFVLTIILLLLLLPTIGIFGAAITSLIVYCCQLILIIRGLHRDCGLLPASLFMLGAKDIKSIVIDVGKRGTC